MALDIATLVKFVKKTQPIMWQRFERQCNSDPLRKFYKCFEDAVSEDGLVSVLRHGFRHRGMDFKVCYFKPESTLNEQAVKHYQQNVTGAEYTLAETETKTGYTESPVGADLAKSYGGFYKLIYATDTAIAADGSTEVEIYYDRYYYLMKLNLDGGYGLEPIYARYGTPITIGEPTKPGYTFDKWEPALPTTMPVGGGEYKALWNLGEAGFNVIFWYENPNPNEDGSYGYSVAGTYKPANVAPGTQKRSPRPHLPQ